MGWVVVVLCGAWYALSSGSNVAGSLLLRELPLPLTATLAQLAAGALLSHAALRLRARPAAPPAAPRWRALAPLAAAKLASTLLGQVSLWRVPVSYAHTVKATTPLWTALLSYAVWGETVSRGVAGALALIAAGVVLASATEARWDAAGLAAALGAAALLSAQHLYCKRVLRSGLGALELLRATSLLAGGALLPLWAWRDAAALAAALAASSAPAPALALLAADALLAWLQALAALAVLARVSPLAYGVASAAKRAAVVLVSLVVLRNPAPPLNLAGMALAAAGVLTYNRAKSAPTPRAAGASRPLLPI